MVTFSVVTTAIVTQADVLAGPSIVSALTDSGVQVHTLGSSVQRALIGGHVGDLCAKHDVDLLVNNAPKLIRETSLSMSEAEFSAALDEGLHSVFSACREAARVAQQASRPLEIINVVSALGIVGLAGRVAEACTSAGVIAATKALAAEWGPFGVRLMTIIIGPTEEWTIEAADSVPGVLPLGTLVGHKDIADAVLALALGQLPKVTGQGLTVDSGWLAHGWRRDD